MDRRLLTTAGRTCPALAILAILSQNASAQGNAASFSDLLANGIRANLNMMRRCYEESLSVAPERGGRIYFTLAVERDGALSGIQAREDTLPNVAMRECVTKSMARWKVPIRSMKLSAPAPAEVQYFFEPSLASVSNTRQIFQAELEVPEITKRVAPGLSISFLTGPIMQIIVDGAVIPHHFSASGKRYIEGRPNKEFKIRLNNPYPEKATADVVVDGKSYASSNWVIAPRGALTIEGWQINSKRSSRFVFSSIDRVAAGNLSGTSLPGQIRVSVLRQQRPGTSFLATAAPPLQDALIYRY